jgi:outer membrane usher protein
MSIRISALPSTDSAASRMGKRPPIPAEHQARPADTPTRAGRTDRPLAVLQPSLKISALQTADKT